MKFNKLAKVLTTFLAAPLAAAPTPESLEITLSIDSVAESASAPWTSNLRFLGATPSAYYDMNVNVDRKTFKIDHPELSVSYITLHGYALCYLYGKDGSVTTVASYGYPQTVPVGPPQVQVNGTCTNPRPGHNPPLEAYQG